MKNKILVICTCMICIGLSTYLTLSRYFTRGTSYDTARLAIFNFDVIGNDENISIDLNETETVDYSFNFIVDSDVIYAYTIQLTNVPNEISIALDNEDYITPIDGEITFDKKYDMKTSHILTFKCDKDITAELLANISIQVTGEQVQ